MRHIALAIALLFGVGAVALPAYADARGDALKKCSAEKDAKKRADCETKAKAMK